MEDKRKDLIYFFCLLLSVSGALLMHFTAQKPLEVTELSSDMIGEKARLSGIVTSKWVHEGHVFLEVNKEKVVVFKDQAKKTDLNPYYILKGDRIAATGKVKRYKGELEVIAEELRWRE